LEVPLGVAELFFFLMDFNIRTGTARLAHKNDAAWRAIVGKREK
jgi:hypothetical protein